MEDGALEGDPAGAAASAEQADFGDEIDVTDLGDLGDDPITVLAAKRVASPVPGRGVTYPYGVKSSRDAAGFHTGQDHAAPVGRPVVAVRSGKIRWSNTRGGAYGRWTASMPTTSERMSTSISRRAATSGPAREGG